MDGSGSSGGEGCLVWLRPAPLFSFDSLKRWICIFCSSPVRRFSMADAPRIAVDELNRRMEAGEGFTVIDVRNAQAWAESDTMLPEAIRVPLDKLEESLPRIPKSKPVVVYCT